MSEYKAFLYLCRKAFLVYLIAFLKEVRKWELGKRKSR